MDSVRMMAGRQAFTDLSRILVREPSAVPCGLVSTEVASISIRYFSPILLLRIEKRCR